MRSVSALVCQFLEVAVHCILFVRAVYPQEVFDRLVRFTCLFLPSYSLPDAHPPCLPPSLTHSLLFQHPEGITLLSALFAP